MQENIFVNGILCVDVNKLDNQNIEATLNDMSDVYYRVLIYQHNYWIWIVIYFHHLSISRI